MNVLFVCHNGFASNSMNHIAGFAAGLRRLGNACVVAVPEIYRDSAAVLGNTPPFRPMCFAQTWEDPRGLFPDGQPVDVIHAWTPRENVRRAVARCRAAMPAADLVIHLEDNEEHLSAAYLEAGGHPPRALTDRETDRTLPLNLAYPRRATNFLRSADALTGIIAPLEDFAPRGTPFAEIWPAVDFDLYHTGPPDPELKQSLGILPEEKVLCYTGNSHFANGAELATLYEAVFLLNRRGTPCRLVRTGVDAADFTARFDVADLGAHVLPLGFVAAERLPGLLRLADVLVQPGADDAFNRHRLPSKLPEFLAVGRPVVMPRSNVGLRVRAGEEALLLETGGPEEIAARCEQVFTDPALGNRLSAGAASFARQHFDGSANARLLSDFYQRACLLWNRPTRAVTPPPQLPSTRR